MWGNTALHWAVANNNTKMALHLLNEAKGIDPNVQDCKGKTPLHLAIGKGWYHFNNDAKSSLINKINEPPQAPVIQALAKRSNINLQDKDGNTPLHIAVIRRDINCIELLLEQGADKNIRNKKDQLPIDMLKMDYEEARNYIEEYASVFTLRRKIWDQNINHVYRLFDIQEHIAIEGLEDDEEKASDPFNKLDEAIKLLTVLLDSNSYSTEMKPRPPRDRFLAEIKELKRKTDDELKKGQCDQPFVEMLANQVIILTRKVAYCVVTMDDIHFFHQATAKVSHWSTLGKILGAIIGAAIGAIIGGVAGPAAGLYAGTKGATIGAGLLGGGFSLWAANKCINARQPLSPLAIAATNAIVR